VKAAALGRAEPRNPRGAGGEQPQPPSHPTGGPLPRFAQPPSTRRARICFCTRPRQPTLRFRCILNAGPRQRTGPPRARGQQHLLSLESKLSDIEPGMSQTGFSPVRGNHWAPHPAQNQMANTAPAPVPARSWVSPSLACPVPRHEGRTPAERQRHRPSGNSPAQRFFALVTEAIRTLHRTLALQTFHKHLNLIPFRPWQAPAPPPWVDAGVAPAGAQPAPTGTGATVPPHGPSRERP